MTQRFHKEEVPKLDEPTGNAIKTANILEPTKKAPEVKEYKDGQHKEAEKALHSIKVKEHEMAKILSGVPPGSDNYA